MAPPRDLAIRPLGPGEIVDRAVALTVRHFRPLFLAMLVVEAPALALARLQQTRAIEVLAALGDPARAAAALPSVATFFAALLVVLAGIQLAATAVATAIVAPTLDPSATGGPPAARRVLAVATASVVQLCALLAAPALGAAPGLALAWRSTTLAGNVVALGAAVVGGAVALLLVLVRLVLVPAVAAVEGRGGVRAALRSWRLMAPRAAARLVDRPGLRASLVLFATFVIALAANGLAGLPRAVAARLAGADGPLGAFGAALPLPLEVSLTVFEAAATAALQPFTLVAVAVLYFDVRARTEALDVEIWAARLEAGP
jgi:hypothetical protein